MKHNISQTEENYLKTIFKICERTNKSASTNAISTGMSTSAASVTDMLQRLSGKELINYAKYKGVTLTEEGNKVATHLIRKHRLWEVFLVDKLDFSWDEVHEIAEQLEHIHSPELVERLDQFLGNPKFDPHGDPIPDADGNFAQRQQRPLAQLEVGECGIIVGVQEHSTPFLQYLDRMNLNLGAKVQLKEVFEFDESVEILVNDDRTITLSNRVSSNLFVQKKECE